MAKMTEQEWRAFLSAGTRTGKLATTRKDGSPHVVPVWFLLEGDELIFTTGSTSLKARNMARDPRVAVSVDDETYPYAFALVRGTAALETPSPLELLPWATKVASRYVGEERAEQYGRRNAVEGEALVRLKIEQVNAYSAVAE